MYQSQNNLSALSSTIPGVNFSDLASTALVVVDVQHSDATANRGWVKACEAVDPGSMRYYLDRLEKRAIPAIRSLLKAFRDSGRPVIHLCTGSLYQDMRDCPARFRDWTRELEVAGGVEDIGGSAIRTTPSGKKSHLWSRRQLFVKPPKAPSTEARLTPRCNVWVSKIWCSAV